MGISTKQQTICCLSWGTEVGVRARFTWSGRGRIRGGLGVGLCAQGVCIQLHARTCNPSPAPQGLKYDCAVSPAVPPASSRSPQAATKQQCSPQHFARGLIAKHFTSSGIEQLEEFSEWRYNRARLPCSRRRCGRRPPPRRAAELRAAATGGGRLQAGEGECWAAAAEGGGAAAKVARPLAAGDGRRAAAAGSGAVAAGEGPAAAGKGAVAGVWPSTAGR